jgi:hypothetical protein
MSIWPSRYESIQKQLLNRLWQIIETIFDNAFKTDSLPRGRWKELRNNYIINRKFDEYYDVPSLKAILPDEISSLRLGLKDIDLIRFLLAYSGDRTLVLFGPRGAGKTSMIHYVEQGKRKGSHLKF